MSLIHEKLRNNLGELLSNSYKPQKEAAENMKRKGYKYDHDLSNMETKVFVDEKNDEPIIVHRGTTRVKDWFDDVKLAVGLGKSTQRVKDAQEINKKVEEKYKKAAHNVGHSLGGFISENAGGHGNIITYNKGAGLGDLFKRKNSKRQLDIFANGDLVSKIAQATQTSNKEFVKNKRSSILKPIRHLNAHSTDNLFY